MALTLQKSHPFVFDAEKAVEAILYIAKKVPSPTKFYISKVMYFADRFHLEKYGRFICGDQYVAMKHGPVPSGVLDAMNAANNPIATVPFSLDKHTLQPHRSPDMEFFSESDLECLDRSISTYSWMSFGRLSEISHDDAWNAADRDDMMTVESIARTMKDGEQIIDYLELNS